MAPTCIEPKYFHRTIATNKWDNASAKFIQADIQEPVFAVQIGPDSDIDRCWLFPGGELDNMVPPTVDAQVRHNPAFHKAIKLSVEAPYVGFMPAGPYGILLPYGRSIAALSGAVERGSPIIADSGWPSSMYGVSDAGEGQIGLDPLLQLVFHRMPVPFLPVKRPPMEWSLNVLNWSALAAPVSHVARIPGFGRKRLSLSLSLADYTAGALGWSMVGVNAIDWGTATIDSQFHRETLDSATGLAADFDETYFFDGEFDYYELTVTEETAMGAAADLRAIIKAWD